MIIKCSFYERPLESPRLCTALTSHWILGIQGGVSALQECEWIWGKDRCNGKACEQQDRMPSMKENNSDQASPLTKKHDSGWLTHHSLEAGVELCEEGRLVPLSQHPFLHHRTFNVIVLDHDIFLQDFDGVQLLRRLHLCQHYLQRNVCSDPLAALCIYVATTFNWYLFNLPCQSCPSPTGLGSWSHSVGPGPCCPRAGWSAGGLTAWSLSYRGPSWLSVPLNKTYIQDFHLTTVAYRGFKA